MTTTTNKQPAEPPRPSNANKVLIFSSIVAALGSFLFGFETAVISGTTEALRKVFGLNDNLLGLTVSSALIGTMIGALFVSRPVDWLGRRKLLSQLAVLFVIASIGCALAWNWYVLLIARWIGGVAVGAASVVCPMYITEIAPPEKRGRLVAISQFNIVVGILAAYLSNYMVAYLLGSNHPDAWRWMFGVMLLPSILFLVAVMFIPESPRWLVMKNRLAEAQSVITLLRHPSPEQELQAIKSSLQSDNSGVHQSVFQRKYLRPLLLVCMIAVFSQLDGINAVIYYSADIFRMSGADHTSALMQSVILGTANLVMTLVAMALIDRVGRKPLLLFGAVTFVIFHALAACVFAFQLKGWIALVAMIGIAGSHSYSIGAVIWVVINELLPNSVRASGSAFACFLMWISCAAVGWLFPILAPNYGAQVFIFFGAMMALMFVLVLKYLPETKGTSLEDLQGRFGAGH